MKPGVRIEMKWIVLAAIEGLPCAIHPSGRGIDIDVGASLERWIEFLGPDCCKEHVPEAMRVLVATGIMTEKDKMYKAALDFKHMNAALRTIDPAYGPTVDKFVADIRRRLDALK